MKIVLVGYIASEAAYKLIGTEKPALSGRFSNRFLYLSQKKMKENIVDSTSIFDIIGKTDPNIQKEDIMELSDTGIYGCLWEFAEANNRGINISLDKISIMQETVEILEYLDLNPYTYPSRGSWLIRTDRAYDLADIFSQAGIQASVIGCETDNKDRVIINKDETRFLTPIDRLLKDEQGQRNLR